MRIHRKLFFLARVSAALALVCLCITLASGGSRVIEIVADHDSRYRMLGQKTPSIVAFAGEELRCRITARKASSQNRDGSIHGFTLLRAKDRSKVPGWDFLLQPGTQEITAHAPLEPGEYEVVCTIICSQDHDGMHMKFIVLPSATAPPSLLPAARASSSSSSSPSGPIETFQGEIADTQCSLNVHSVTRSHKEMIAARSMGQDAASCARYCVRHMGGSFILLKNKTIVYRLDNQPKAEALAGEKVRITGTLDKPTNTIYVATITAAQ